MLYAFQIETDGVVRTIVSAADTVVNLEFAVDRMVADGVPGEKPDYLAFLTDKLFKGLDNYPFVAQHLTRADASAFCESYGVVVLAHDALLAQHQTMVETAKELYDPQADQRSIREIYGLDKHDPWDTRTEEQKAIDALKKEAADKAKGKGNMTGESFSADQSTGKDDDLNITNVTAHQDKDGKVHIDSVMALKGGGYYQTPGDDGAAQETPQSAAWTDHWRLDLVGDDGDCIGSVMQEASVPNNRLAHSGESVAGGLMLFKASEAEMRRISSELTRVGMTHTVSYINSDGTLTDHAMSDTLDPAIRPDPGVFHKVAIPGYKLRDIMPVLIDTSVNPISTGRVVMQGMMPVATEIIGGFANDAAGCWLAYEKEVKANHAQRLLKREKIASTVCPVNADGSAVDPNAPMVQATEPDPGPRPWNSRASELEAMDEVARAANLKSYKPAEFLFCGRNEVGTGETIIFVTPRSYFLEHGAMWDQPLGIAHLLPPDLREISPGVYRSRVRNWTYVSFDLNQSGFRESIKLQLHLNSL